MPSKIEHLGPCEKLVEVTIDAATIEAALEGKLREIRNSVQLPGFRAGKVPAALLERRFGEQIRQEALEDLVEEGVRAALKEQELKPLSRPELELTEGEQHLKLPIAGDLSFQFRVDIAPTFEVPKSRGIAIEQKKRKVTEARIDEVLTRFAQRHANFETIDDETAVYDSEFIVQFLATAEDPPSGAEDDEGEVYLDEEVVIWHELAPDLNDEILLENGVELLHGAKVGDEFDVVGRFKPDHEDKELAGMPVQLHLEIQEFRRRVIPALDEEFAKRLGEESVESLRGKVREDLERNLLATSKEEAIESLLDHLLSLTTIDLPARVVDAQVHEVVHRLARRMAAPGQALDHAAMHALVGPEQEAKVKEKVERDSRVELLLEAIADKHKVFCLEEDVLNELKAIAERHETPISAVREYYERENLMGELRREVRERKTREFLFEQAEVSLVEIEDDDSTENALAAAN